MPSDKELAERKEAGIGLTRPEIAVLLSYSKMDLYPQILQSSLPDEESLASELTRYFPRIMSEEFAEAIANHPLRREIIATSLTNSIVNRAGISFALDMAEKTGKTLPEISDAYAKVRDQLNLRELQKGKTIQELIDSQKMVEEKTLHALV